MKKSSCELLLQGYPKISEVEELRSTYFANSVFNNPRDKENFVFAEDFKNIVSESCCFWCWCWFIGPTILHLTSGQVVRKKRSWV